MAMIPRNPIARRTRVVVRDSRVFMRSARAATTRGMSIHQPPVMVRPSWPSIASKKTAHAPVMQAAKNT